MNNFKKQLSKLEEVRFEKLLWLQKNRFLGKVFETNAEISEILEKFSNIESEKINTDYSENIYSIIGRIVSFRKFKGSSFLTILNNNFKIQIYASDKLIDENSSTLLEYLDIGDIIFIKGKIFRTKSNELTIRALELGISQKSISPIADKYKGLENIETKYRHRYLDIISSQKSFDVFWFRTKIIKEIKRFFDNKGYLEVETPILNNFATGADAKPFLTHHNSLKQDFALRIAPELFLKRLIVAGFPKVYEIGRLFRNEGISYKHNPEYTSIETYEINKTYKYYIKLMQDLIHKIASVYKVALKEKLSIDVENLKVRNGYINLLEDFEVITMREYVKKHLNIDFYDEKINIAKLKEIILKEKKDIDINDLNTRGELMNFAFEEFCEEKIIKPIFVTQHPREISPLSKPNKSDPRFVDRFELFIGSSEYANGYSELNDAQEQQLRFEEQSEDNVDLEYIHALKIGLPETVGLGIGIDRLIMLFTESNNIKDVILFPHLKNI